MESLTNLEEFDIMRKLQFPHTLPHGDLIQSSSVSSYISSKNADELLLITPSGFSNDFIFAGLLDTHIEFLANNAPREYKEEIIPLALEEENITSELEIAMHLDGNMRVASNMNQIRVKNVIQYIKDNRIAFEF